MKSMNDMTMEELLEVDRKINHHFWEEANFARKEDLPEWAAAIDSDILYQERMGAFKCEDCGAIVKHHEFRCKNCAALNRAKKEMIKQQKEKERTMKWLRK